MAPLVCWLGVAAPAAALAQTASQPPVHHTARRRPHRKSRRQRHRPPRQNAEVPRSLFEPTWRQFQIGGRLSSVSGDPARWQRYQDLRDGVLFTDARYEREVQMARGCSTRAADNVGYRDQRYFADYERTGRFVITGLWDADPAVLQRRYEDAVYGHRRHAGARRRDAARDPERPGQSQRLRPARAGSSTCASGATSAVFDIVATPTPNLDVKASFTTQKHSGELPWGASFGFSNDVEVALPYDSRANDLTIGTEWTNARNMLRVAYSGSWFDNIAPTLTWDSPLASTTRRDSRGADACPSGRRTRPRPSASPATPSWRARRR